MALICTGIDVQNGEEVGIKLVFEQRSFFV